MARFLGLVLLLSTLVITTTADTITPNEQSCEVVLGGEDCAAYPFESCDSSTLTCVHKDLFPAQVAEILTYILLPIFFAVASVGGVGGGILMLPLAIGMLKFSTKEAIALTSAIVTESVLIRFIFFSAHAKHPDKPNSTEIDYDLVRVVFPMFLIGSYFGVILSVSLGDLILGILLMTLMTVLSCQTLWKAINLFKKESAKL